MYISELYIKEKNPLMHKKKKKKFAHHDEAQPLASQNDRHYKFVSIKEKQARQKEQDRRRIVGK